MAIRWIFMLCLSLPILQLHAAPMLSQAASSQEVEWVRIRLSPADGVDLRYQLTKTDSGWTVAFRNFGTGNIHFGVYLAGIQTREDAYQNGRFHATPNRFVGVIDITVTDSTQIPTPVLIEVRLGEDQGDFWRD